MDQVFECKKCGHCCEGRGGIVLSQRDLDRLAAFLGVDPAIARERYAELSNGKLKVRTGPDGFCIFFKTGSGCAVHAGKPDICRAWPFFRGNLVDDVSLDMARDFCPGISRATTFENFQRAGREYLRAHGLDACGGGDIPTALRLPPES